MRKLLLSLVMSICLTLSFAQNYNREQETLRDEIRSYLSQQGFNPQNQIDGLKFKSDGKNYYVEIDKDETNPMFVRLCRYIKFDERISRERILENLNSYNVKYGVKVSCQEKDIQVVTEMFVLSASDFTCVFADLLSQVKSAAAKVLD